MSVFFNGQLLVTPQTASAVNDDAMLNQNLSVGNSVAYVGECTNGKPFTVLRFGSPDQARVALGSGDLCEAVIKAFSPSAETGSPGTVYAVRVNHAFQAKLDLMQGGDTPTVFGTLTGNTWGVDDMSTKCKVEVDASTGYADITVEGVKAGIPWSVTGTDVNAPGVYIELLEDDAQITFSNTAHELFRVEMGYSLPWDDPQFIGHSLHPEAYTTLGAIADYVETLRNQAGKQAYRMTFTDDAYRNLPSTILDFARYDTKGSHGVSWNAYSIKKWFDNNVDGVTFVHNEAKKVYNYHGLLTQDFKFLAAEKTEPTTPTDWNQAFELLQTEDIQWVTPLTALDDIHAMAVAHCTVCSNVLKRERRTILGMSLNVADDDAIKYAKKLNNDRVSLVHLGHYNYDLNGKLALKPAYMTAALISAAFAGLNPGTPLTNKTLSVMGWERDLRNPTDTDKLLLGGVLPVENTETGYKVTQSISTWLVDSKYNKREQSCGVAIDFTVRNIRNALDVLRGSKQTPILLSRAVSLAKGQLTELARPEPQGPAVLVGDENSPAWRNVTATIEGDVLRVQFEASPAIPNNYILVTMYAVPYSGSATA
ncbi:hypothetical protein ACLMYS_003873 [Salmonella enterica]